MVRRYKRKRKTNTKSLVKREVASALSKNLEMKHRLMTTTANTVGFTGMGFAPLDNITQGVTTDDRIGGRIQLHSMYLNGFLNGPVLENDYIRYFCVQTRRPLAISSGNVYDIRPLFDITGQTLGNAIGGFDYDWVTKVFWDKVVTMNATSPGPALPLGNQTPVMKRIKAYKKVGGKYGLRCVFDQDASAPAINYPKTYIYYGFVGHVISNANNVAVTSVLKLRYTDA